MACFTFTAELASSFFGAAYRNPKPFTPLQASFLPLLRSSSRSRRTTTTHFQPLYLNSHSFSRIFFHNPSKHARRFTAAASTSAPPQTEDSDVSTAIPPDNRIPATIITGFLGSGKVSSYLLISLIHFKISVSETLNFKFDV